MTRAMLVTVLWRLADSPENELLYANYSDVAQQSFYEMAVAWAAKNGIVYGTGEGFFAPDAGITRQDVAVILARYMDYAKIEVNTTDDYRLFTDEALIADYAKNAIQLLNKLEIINGTGTDQSGAAIINPTGNATRAEVAAMLNRFVTNVANAVA
jgi:hypothetical protein